MVDETNELQVAAAKLAWWRAEIDGLYAGKPQHPVTKALAPFIEKYSLPKEQLDEIIDGMEMDLTQTRYLDWPGLERYCYRVAGVVGLLAAGIFGYRDPRTLEYARDLGIAFQLTNIIRDVGEDARKNRIYLPMDELKRFERARRGHPQWAADAAVCGADAIPGPARARLLRQRVRRAARLGPPRAAPRAHHGGDLQDAARGDRARRLPRADAAHFAYAAPQVLDCLEDMARLIGSAWLTA